MLMKIYSTLLKEHGPQRWWPCRTANRFEICVGAILTQNTSWTNVEKAIDNLIKARCLDARKIARMHITKLQKLIRPSGFFRQKSKRLKDFSAFVLGFGSTGNFLKSVTRGALLQVNGIGPETADSILLYACDRPYFVVDSYTRRMLSSLGLIDANSEYESIKQFFEERLEMDVGLYKEFHALIVRHSKECCRGFLKEGCILRSMR
jgi:endonuclease-3 related protein